MQKKRIRLRWFLLFLLLAGTALYFLPVKIPLAPFLKTKLEAWKRLGISAEHIAITPRGQIRARKVVLGNPVACRIGDLILDISLAKILEGRLAFHRVAGRSIQVDWPRLDAFFQDLQRQVPARHFRDYLSSFSFRAYRMEITGLVPTRLLQVDRATLDLKWRPSLVTDVRAQGVSLRGFPALPSISFRFHGWPNAFELENLAANWGPVGLEGNISRDSVSDWEGTLAFKNLDLGMLTRPRLENGRMLEGVMQGSVAFTAGSFGDGNRFEASGSAMGERMRIRNFPFQRDEAIRNYMPALHDVRFHSLHVARWRLLGTRLHIDSMAASGSPLSVEGHGHIALGDADAAAEKLDGEVYFGLTGHLSESYYQSLGPIVQSGLYRNREGVPSFKIKIVGDFDKQQVRMRKPPLSRVVKSITRSIGEKFKSLVGED